jgi:hypothetical protein
MAVSKSDGDTPSRDADALTASTSSEPMFSAPVIFAMIAAMMVVFWTAHQLAHLYFMQFGIMGGLVAYGVIYAASLIMDHFNL